MEKTWDRPRSPGPTTDTLPQSLHDVMGIPVVRLLDRSNSGDLFLMVNGFYTIWSWAGGASQGWS
jgi:hypothetical protein